MKVPFAIWATKIIGFILLFFYQAFLEVEGRGAGEKKLRVFWLLTGILLILAGLVMLYYAPTGGYRIRTETESRIWGGLILLLGISFAILSRGSVEKMRDEFERSTSDRWINPDPDRYVSPKDRVLGKSSDDDPEKKPWE